MEKYLRFIIWNFYSLDLSLFAFQRNNQGFDNLRSQSVSPPQWTMRNVDDRWLLWRHDFFSYTFFFFCVWLRVATWCVSSFLTGIMICFLITTKNSGSSQLDPFNLWGYFMVSLCYLIFLLFCLLQEPYSSLHLKHVQRDIGPSSQSCWYGYCWDGSLGKGASSNMFLIFHFPSFLVRALFYSRMI